MIWFPARSLDLDRQRLEAYSENLRTQFPMVNYVDDALKTFPSSA